jgi:DNA invertase Pin-like site-specific DNA recombinase
MKAVGYVRLSKPQRNKDGTIREDPYGIDAQRRAIQSAADYNGWDLVETFVDNGKTGANTNRDGYQQALAMLQAGEADMLVAARYDRLTRSTKDLIELMELSVKQSWAVSILDQRVDTSTAVGRLMARTLASHAEFERDLISERTKAALVEVAKVKHVGRSSQIKPKVKRRVIAMHEQGMSASAIARAMTAEGHEVENGRTRWHHSVVRALLVREGAAS